jgi:hypothetical protein
MQTSISEEYSASAWGQQLPTQPHGAVTQKTLILIFTDMKTWIFFRNIAHCAIYIVAFPCSCTSSEADVFIVYGSFYEIFNSLAFIDRMINEIWSGKNVGKT